jgi:hypothetical protein
MNRGSQLTARLDIVNVLYLLPRRFTVGGPPALYGNPSNILTRSQRSANH